jgi:hypothetical protein
MKIKGFDCVAATSSRQVSNKLDLQYCSVRVRDAIYRRQDEAMIIRHLQKLIMRYLKPL